MSCSCNFFPLKGKVVETGDDGKKLNVKTRVFCLLVVK